MSTRPQDGMKRCAPPSTWRLWATRLQCAGASLQGGPDQIQVSTTCFFICCHRHHSCHLVRISTNYKHESNTISVMLFIHKLLKLCTIIVIISIVITLSYYITLNNIKDFSVSHNININCLQQLLTSFVNNKYSTSLQTSQNLNTGDITRNRNNKELVRLFEAAAAGLPLSPSLE